MCSATIGVAQSGHQLTLFHLMGMRVQPLLELIENDQHFVSLGQAPATPESVLRAVTAVRAAAA